MTGPSRTEFGEAFLRELSSPLIVGVILGCLALVLVGLVGMAVHDEPDGPTFQMDAPEYEACVEATGDPVSCWNAYVGGVVAGWEQGR